MNDHESGYSGLKKKKPRLSRLIVFRRQRKYYSIGLRGVWKCMQILLTMYKESAINEESLAPN